MKRPLIVKAGLTFPEPIWRLGDFEDWAREVVGFVREEILMVDAPGWVFC